MESSTVQVITLLVFMLMMITLCLLNKGCKKETSPLCCFCRCFETARKVHEDDKRRKNERKSRAKIDKNCKTNSEKNGKKSSVISISMYKKSPLKVTFEDSAKNAANNYPSHEIDNAHRKELLSSEIKRTEKQKMRTLNMILKEEGQTSFSADCIYCIV